jgi:hypothetical protein
VVVLVLLARFTTGRGDTVHYALLINEHPNAYDGLSSAEQDAISAEYIELRKDERMVGGAKLQPAETATTVRMQNGEVLLTDGPFADTKEIFGGFYILDASDLDTALKVAASIPAVRLGGSVEVRPLVKL